MSALPANAPTLVVITGVGRAGRRARRSRVPSPTRGASVALLDVSADEVQARAQELRADGFTATAHAAT